MRLLKLVPDNTNIDFMRWRHWALILSLLATVASLALVGVRGLNLGIDFVGGQVVRTTFAKPVDIEDLRGRIANLQVGDASIQEFGDDRTYQIRLPKPEGPEAAANQVVTKVRALIQQRISRRPGRCRRKRVGQGVRRTGDGRRAGDRVRDGRDRDLHLVPVRMAVRGRRAGHLVPRRGDDARLLLADPAAGRSQRRRGDPRDRRLFAQRHRRHLRPDPRKSAQISQDGDRPACSTSRSTRRCRGRWSPRCRSCSRSAALLVLGPDVHVRADHRDLPRHLHRHLLVDLHLGADPGAGWASRPTASSATTKQRAVAAKPA